MERNEYEEEKEVKNVQDFMEDLTSLVKRYREDTPKEGILTVFFVSACGLCIDFCIEKKLQSQWRHVLKTYLEMAIGITDGILDKLDKESKS